MSLCAAVMQPTYLPWLGYLDLLDQVDVFVFLDDVAFARRSWQQRNRIVQPGGLAWLSVPVAKAPVDTPLDQIRLVDDHFVAKHTRTLEHAYARAPQREAWLPGLRDAYRAGVASGLLVELDLALIRYLAAAFGIETRTERASQLALGGRRGRHIALLCEKLGADRYLSPAGSSAYLDAELGEFSERGIRVAYQQYLHPVYRQQHAPFTSHASALDLLLNEGGADGAAILRSGRRPAVSPEAPR